MPLTGVIYYVFLHLYLLFYCQIWLQEMLISKQSHSHRAQICRILFFIYQAVETSYIKRLDTKYVERSWPLRSLNVTTLTFQGHVTSSVTWPFDSQGAISYRCSIGTKPVFPAIVETMGPKYIRVMTLTYLGRVTSSVTWPFESQAISILGHDLDLSGTRGHRSREHLIPR